MRAAAASKHQVSPPFVKSIIAAESGFSQAAVSLKGAIGLMQLMPETAREFGADPAVPEQNIDAGTHYLSWLLRRYAGKRDALRRAIAAYNAGPGAVERYRGVRPFRETRTYVTRVLRFYKKYDPAYALASLRGARNRPNKTVG
jgi:soluble lytic murein transglycosylase-like protein